MSDIYSGSYKDSYGAAAVDTAVVIASTPTAVVPPTGAAVARAVVSALPPGATATATAAVTALPSGAVAAYRRVGGVWKAADMFRGISGTWYDIVTGQAAQTSTAPSGGTTTPPAVGTIQTTGTVNLTTVTRDLGVDGPTFAGLCSSTYGRRPSTNSDQAAAERALDARYWRLPVRWNTAGYIATSALGAGNFSLEPDIALYYSWGHRILLILAGQGGDMGTWTAGDATKVAQRLATLGYDLNRFDFSGPNEPGLDGSIAASERTTQKILDRNIVIYNELQTVLPGRKVWGPVHFMYNRPEIDFHQTGMGAARLAGTNYHHYQMGGNNDPQDTATAFAGTPSYATEITQLKADAAAAGVSVEVSVDELNFSVKPDYGTPVDMGGYVFTDGSLREGRLFRAINTVWIASAMGHIMRAGGRGLPYATQNKSLGITVQNEYDGDTVNLPESGGMRQPDSSPMPAYWGIAAWTGGGAPGAARQFPHMNRRFYSTSSSTTDTEVFAVDNEAGGYNLVLINKRENDSQNVRLALTGTPVGAVWDRWSSVKSAPYGAFAKTGTYAVNANVIDVALTACSVTVLVLNAPTTVPPSQVEPTDYGLGDYGTGDYGK